MFRHAERENSGTSNPPLSTRGLKQADLLSQWIQNQKLPAPSKLMCSPRLRAHQTLRPLQVWSKIEIQTVGALDERLTSESAEQFRKRIQGFLSLCENSLGAIYFVTHLDWIEEALTLIPSDDDLTSEKYMNWRPGQFLEFDVHDGLWHLQKSGSLNL